MPALHAFLLALLLATLAPGLRADPVDAAGAARAAAAFAEALQHAEQERWDHALEAVERAHKATPHDPRVGLLRIEALVAVGRRGEAERVLDEDLWHQLGQGRWSPVLRSYSPEVLTSWARRVALRRFARGAPPAETADAARAALAGYRDPANSASLGHQLAIALVALRTGPRAEDRELTAAGHELLAARCPPAFAVGALALPWLVVVLLLPWGPRSRGVATALGAGLLVAEVQVLAAGLAGAWRGGVWTLLLEAPVGPVAHEAMALAGALGAAGLGLLLAGCSLLRGRPPWLRELLSGPAGEDLREGVRWGAGVVAWLGLLVLAQAAWRAAGGRVGLLEAARVLLASRTPTLGVAGGWLALVVALRVVVAPWLEEAVFRGALFGRLRDVFGWRGGAVLSAWAFALAHGRDPLALLGVGILLAAARHRTQRLWVCVIAHAIWNAVALLATIALMP